MAAPGPPSRSSPTSWGRASVGRRRPPLRAAAWAAVLGRRTNLGWRTSESHTGNIGGAQKEGLPRRSGASHPTRPGSRAARCSCGNARTDPGCGSAPYSSPRPRWSGTAACQAFGTGPIARPAMWMTPPTRCSSRMGALCFGDLGLLYGCSRVLTAPSTVAPSFKGLPTRLVSPWPGLAHRSSPRMAAPPHLRPRPARPRRR